MAVGMAVATMGRDDAAAGEECAGSDELPDETWREITVAEGSQGPRSYMFSAQRVRVTRTGKPGEEAGAAAGTWTAASPATTCPTLPKTQCWRLWRTWAVPGGALNRSSRRKRVTWGWTNTRPGVGLAGITT